MKTTLLCISALMALVPALMAGEGGLEVIAASDDLLESHPRRIVTSVFFVTNGTDEEKMFTPRIDLPPGWQLIASDRLLRLKPGQREMSLVSFLIPRTAAAGSYTVSYSVETRDRAVRGASSSIRVHVIPVTRLHLEVLDCPDFVVGGEAYRVSAVVINQGNTTAEIDLTTSSQTGFPMEGSRRNFSLPPGESAVIEIGVKTDPGIRKVTRERLTLTARATNPPKATEQTWCYLEILPRISGTSSRYRRVPVMAAISYFSEDDSWDRSRAQGSLRGSGNLDANGAHHVDFALRGPDLGQNRLLGNRDEYYLNYRFGSHSVVLGDYSYSVSPLTESHRYGRGGKGKAVFDRFELSAYHMKARWAEPDERQTAGSIDYHLGDDSILGMRYLKRVDEHASEMMSVETRLHPADGTGLDMEYARGFPRGDGNEAYRLKLMTLASWGSYLLRFIHADASYPGYFQNMDFISTSLGLNFSRDFRLDASFRQERHNLNLDPLGYTAPLERDYRLRLLFRSGTETDYSLAYRFRESRDRFAEPIFNFRERSVRAALSRRQEMWDCHAAAELGRTLDRLAQQTRRLERYTASVRVKPGKRHSYHGYFYYDRSVVPAQRERRHLSAGVTASVLVGSGTALDASFRSNMFADLDDQDRDVFELSLRQRLFGGTELVFKGHYTDYRYSDESEHLAFMVEYNIPFGMPVSRRADVGSLKGKVYDLETERPLPDVILRLDGLTAVSDRAGRFSFPTVPAGTHYLKVDRSSIGMDRITSRRLPMEIAIAGGQTMSMDVPVVRGAALRGRVDLYAYEDSSSGVLTPTEQRRLVIRRGLANTVVELTDGDEIKRSLTAGDGSFAIEEIRPGRWTLTIPSENLPDHHTVHSGEIHLMLEPGGDVVVAIRVVPRERTVHIIEDGGTLTEQSR